MPALLLRADRLKGESRRAGLPPERLDGFSGVFPPGTVCELLGPEDGGKHLLWRLLTLLERPAEGELWIGGRPVACLAEDQIAEIRNQSFGYLFATPYLLPGFTVVENVAMPLLKLRRIEPAQASARTQEILQATGLLDLSNAELHELSALQHQLVALARAVIHDPVLLALEHFGHNLAEAETGCLSEVCRVVAARYGFSVLATAAPGVALAWADLTLEVANGRVTEAAKTPGAS